MKYVELHMTLEQLAVVELGDISYYLHRYDRSTGKYIVRFSFEQEYWKAYYLLGAETTCR